MNVVDVLERSEEFEAKLVEGIGHQKRVKGENVVSELSVGCFEDFGLEEQVDEVAEGVESRPSHKDGDAPWRKLTELQSKASLTAELQRVIL